jgi:hypothetical protein
MATTSTCPGSNQPITTFTAPRAEVTAAESFLFELVTAALYHRARLAWFSGLHRLGMFINILAGTGAVVGVVSKAPILVVSVSLLLATISAASLAFDFAGFARKHEDARRLFHDLAAELEESSGNDTALRQLRAQMIRAAATHPSVYEAVEAMAYNAAIRSLGRDTNQEFVLTTTQKLLSHVKTFDGKHFPKRNELNLSSL